MSRVPDPGVNFRDAFSGTTNDGNGLASALVSIVFSYKGYQNAFNVVNEIRNPVRSIKIHGFVSVVVVAVLYMFCNIAYFSAVPKQTFAESSELAAGVFFTTVFGEGAAETALNVLILLSAYGNLLAVLIGQSRMIREIGRQGVLPFTNFWVSTRPFGTPLGPYLLKWGMTVIMIIAPPAGDAFQFGKSPPKEPRDMPPSNVEQSSTSSRTPRPCSSSPCPSVSTSCAAGAAATRSLAASSACGTCASSSSS